MPSSSVLALERARRPFPQFSEVLPLVSGRWRVLGAALRRVVASRRAVPTDVKEQPSALSGKMRISIPHSPAGFKREMQLLGNCAWGARVDARRETRDANGDNQT